MRTDHELTLQVARLADYAVVTAAGSIDFTTQARLEEHLGKALEMTRVAVIVDMTAVTFCDSVGLNVFAQARRQATARGITMIMAGLQHRVQRVFAITRLDQAFHSRPDVATAVSWLENGTGLARGFHVS
jgi:anti-sigma B factor antagonist